MGITAFMDIQYDSGGHVVQNTRMIGEKMQYMYCETEGVRPEADQKTRTHQEMR